MKTSGAFPLLTDVLPTLSAELKPSLIRAGEMALAASIDSLRVHALCNCGDPECMKLYTSAEKHPCPGDYRVVLPDAVLTMGVCEEAISSIEDYAADWTTTNARIAEFVRLRQLVKPRRS